MSVELEHQVRIEESKPMESKVDRNKNDTMLIKEKQYSVQRTLATIVLTTLLLIAFILSGGLLSIIGRGSASHEVAQNNTTTANTTILQPYNEFCRRNSSYT